MRATPLLALLLLPLTPALAAGPAAPPAGARCSLIPLVSARLPTRTHLLATAGPDTVRAGRGGVTPGDGGGHWSRPRRGGTYGQVVAVERFGGADSAAVAAAFDSAGTREAVLVPWDYDPACQPLPWGGSARWLPVGQEGAFLVQPRAREHWVDGRPTFDAFTVPLDAYPFGMETRSRALGGSDGAREPAWLAPADFYSLYRALPTRDDARPDPTAAEAALARWEAEHPAARDRFPAEDMLREARRWMRRGR